jgi:hypothetical protein
MGTRPCDGLSPTTLQKLAGLRSERDHVTRQRNGRASAAAAAGFGCIPRIECGPEDFVVSLGARAELRRIGLAQHDRSRGCYAFDQRRIVIGNEILENARSDRCADSVG